MRNESITSGLASRRLRVVLDTNQFVSALIRTGGLQDRLIGAWADGRFVAVISPLLLDELRNVIRRPRLVERYGLTQEKIVRFLRFIEVEAVMVSGNVRVKAVPGDPDDDAVLACAVEAEADYIVSGDRHLLVLGSYEGIHILRAAEFLAILDG